MLVGTAGAGDHLRSRAGARQSISVNGRVLALVAKDDGTYVAHGVGAFGIRFYISYFGPAETEPRFTYQVAQPVTSMAAWRMAWSSAPPTRSATSRPPRRRNRSG